MILQLLVLSAAFFGLAGWFWIRKKKVLAVTFGLIGFFCVAAVCDCEGIVSAQGSLLR